MVRLHIRFVLPGFIFLLWWCFLFGCCCGGRGGGIVFFCFVDVWLFVFIYLHLFLFSYRLYLTLYCRLAFGDVGIGFSSLLIYRCYLSLKKTKC